MQSLVLIPRTARLTGWRADLEFQLFRIFPAEDHCGSELRRDLREPGDTWEKLSQQCGLARAQVRKSEGLPARDTVLGVQGGRGAHKDDKTGPIPFLQQ